MAQRFVTSLVDRVKNDERVSKFVADLEDRVPPYVFNGLAGGAAGALLAPLPTTLLMMFKFRTWEDFFIGYVLFSWAASGNAIFSEKGTPKELLILTGVLVHWAVSLLYGTVMSYWSDKTSDPAMIVGRSLLLSVAMHYVNLVFVPKVWRMPLFNDFLDYTGYYPHMLCHLAFGATAGSVIAWMKTQRSGVGRGRRRERVGQTTKESTTSTSSDSAATTGQEGPSATERVKDTVTNVLGNIHEKLTSAAEAVVGTVQQQSQQQQQTPPSSSETPSTTSAAAPPKGTSGEGTSTSTSSSTGTPSATSAQHPTSAVEPPPSYKDVAKQHEPAGTTTAAGPSSSSSAASTTHQRLHQAQPYLDATAAGKQLNPDMAGTKKFEGDNPVPSVGEKKRL